MMLVTWEATLPIPDGLRSKAYGLAMSSLKPGLHSEPAWPPRNRKLWPCPAPCGPELFIQRNPTPPTSKSCMDTVLKRPRPLALVSKAKIAGLPLRLSSHSPLTLGSSFYNVRSTASIATTKTIAFRTSGTAGSPSGMSPLKAPSPPCVKCWAASGSP